MKHKIFDENLKLIEVEGDIDDVLGSNYVIRRMKAYDVNQQLNFLYDDIEAGLFGEAAKTGKFYQLIQQIKQDIPKN